MGNKAERSQDLRGMRVLVVDDEFLIATAIEQTLADAGADIVSAATLPAALKIATEEPLSAALLDVRLGRQTSEEIADMLAARGIPFVFYTGQPLPDGMREKHPAAEVLIKPIHQDAFVRAIRQCTSE
jgi:DNA-binding NtrC family response regulator